ncbi:MAG: hypothetical protein LUE86_10135 [Clostridiales bacterium]|nr:hypothetical protein [Clostridiales bacterium]
MTDMEANSALQKKKPLQGDIHPLFQNDSPCDRNGSCDFPVNLQDYRHGRKAFLSVPGSMTLEATLVLSLFIFASVVLMLPMKIMTTERRMQAGLEAVGEDLSRYAYILDVLNRGDTSSIQGADEEALNLGETIGTGAILAYVQGRVMEHVDTAQVSSVHVLDSEILKEDGMIRLVVRYDISFPFPVLGVASLSRSVCCSRRAWIGREGKAGSGEGSGSQQDPIVYVGKNSTRYHLSRSCHYLSNNLTAVSLETVGDMRNTGGGKYAPCSVCGGLAAAGGTVYIMPSGSSYHTSVNCTAIIAYVRAVHLSEVSYLGACSYCGAQ